MIGISSNKLADQLSTMPDQALPRMAQQYKDDAITLSMILSEKNRRDRVRQTGAAQQAQQPQAKVNDQVVASMQPMPETVGIGALPAPNMQGMAEGGIIAFGDGGDVQRFAGAGDSLVRSTTGGRDYFLDVPETIRDPSVPYYRQIPNPLASLAGKKFGSREEAAQAYNAAAGIPTAAAPTSAPVAAAPAVVTPGVTPTGGVGNLSQPATAMRPAAAPAPGAGGPRASVAAAAPRAPVVPDKDYLTQLDAMKARAGDAVDPTALLKQNQTTKEVQAEEAALAQRKIEQKAEFDEMFKGREERIGKRETELGKSKDTNTGMAFLEAGLAMMQARGPGLAGIAQGAGVGLKQYQSGIKDIRAAQEKLDDARDRIEELRQNQSSMNKREVRDAEKGIRAIVNQGDRELIKGVETATGVQREDFRSAVTSNIARAEAEKTRAFQAQQGALDRASRAAIAGMPGDQQRMLTTLGGKGGLEAGLAKMQEIQADKTGAAYAKLFTETVAEANKAGVTPPTAAQFAASLRQLATAMNPAKVPGVVETGAATRP